MGERHVLEQPGEPLPQRGPDHAIARGRSTKQALALFGAVWATAVALPNHWKDWLVAVCNRLGPRGAARIWGAAQRLREEIGAPLPAKDRANHDRDVAAARAVLANDAAFDLAWLEGRAMLLEHAIEYALVKDKV